MGLNTLYRPSALMIGGGDFISSDSGVADADLCTLYSVTPDDVDSEEDVSVAITGADLDCVSDVLNGPSWSCSSRSFSFSSTATSDNSTLLNRNMPSVDVE